MSNIISSLLKKFRNLSHTTIIVSIIVIAILGISGYLLRPKTPIYQFVAVKQNSITEIISVTGNTTPISSVFLGFGNNGTIAHVYSSIGKNVGQGQILAELNTGDLYAQVKQAQANVDIQQAKLYGLQAGSRSEDIAASQASLDKAQQDLANMYEGIGDISLDGYAKANDAVRVQLDHFFSDSETDTKSPTLTYITSNNQAQLDAEAQRSSVTTVLNKWQTELASNDQSTSASNALLQNGISYLATVRQLLNNISKTLDNTTTLTLDATTLATYKANVTLALNEVNTATKNFTTASQNIASQKMTILQLQAQLDLKKAGSSPQDIQAQQAQVESAVAAAQSAEAKLQNSQIVAPISGVITQFDAKIGQFASPGTTLISIISGSSFEIDALVSESDVGKVTLNNKVTMTLDAFPGETFTGLVFYIDPAQTTTEGVVGYKIKVALDTTDTRMKSGLTANLNVETKHKDNVLILPQYAILQNDQGTFVEVVKNGTIKDVPVTLGIQDQNGNVEIVSGITEGEQVLNIGLKQK